MHVLQTGQSAPEFTLLDHRNRPRRLSDYRGRWLLLIFYPKNSIIGNTIQTNRLKTHNAELRAMGAAIVGIGLSSPERHHKLTKKKHLTFQLLSDTYGEISREYGAVTQLGPFQFSKRCGFLIDPEGRIVRTYRSINTMKHTAQVIADLKSIKNSA